MTNRLLFTIIVAFFIPLVAIESGTAKEQQLPLGIDHLVYATPDLQKSIADIERLLGVKVIPGGQHPGAGTRNALVGLGEKVYLEIIGPDPDQPKPTAPRRFGIDDLKEPRLVTWAAKAKDLEKIVQQAKGQAIDLGVVQPGSRKRPDGVLLAWKLTTRRTMLADGVLPFFIDWGETVHPASSLPKDCTLIEFHAEHPDVAKVQEMARKLGLELRINQGPVPALVAKISTPSGTVELR